MATISLSPSAARTALIGLRGGLVAGWFAPATMAKVFGLDPAPEPSLPYLMRLFTVRDGALAFLTAATKKDAQRLVLKTGVVVDAADVVAGVLSATSGKTPVKAAALATITAASAVALGVIALQD